MEFTLIPCQCPLGKQDLWQRMPFFTHQLCPSATTHLSIVLLSIRLVV
jgi:hypothetical protein